MLYYYCYWNSYGYLALDYFSPNTHQKYIKTIGYDIKRMFRTGDLVRVFEQNRGGVGIEGGGKKRLLLEFLGRKDNVIKLGGFNFISFLT